MVRLIEGMSKIGVAKDEIETPALLIDLDAMDRNISKMAEYFRGVKSKLRPHAKTHKSPIIARKQLDAGARGITCQKLGEAEVMVATGIKDILITNEVVDPEKIERLVNLSKHSQIIVAVDDLTIARATSEAALRNNVKQDIVVEVDVGINRCGVQPGKPTIDFTRKLIKLGGLNFRGLMGYEGPFFNIPEFEKRRLEANKRNRLLVETRDTLENIGIDVEVVSAGATGTYNITGEYPGITEVEAGSYVFMDTTYRKLEGVGFECALTLLVTIISRPTPDRAVVNAGMKGVTQEFGMPQVKGMDGVQVYSLSEEHGNVKLTSPSRRLRIGDKVELIPSHCCTTVNLHDRYYGIRKGRLEVVWDIPARGKFY